MRKPQIEFDVRVVVDMVEADGELGYV